MTVFFSSGYFPFQKSKNNAFLELRTGHFRGLVGFDTKAKDFKMLKAKDVLEDSTFGNNYKKQLGKPI